MRPVLDLPAVPDAGAVSALTDQLQVPDSVATILVNRGYAAPEAAKAFLRPRLAHLHDPWMMAGMEQAVERVYAAIDSGETILVHGDYDVDGVCGTTLLTRALRQLGAKVEPFVPNRLKHGYDFTAAGLAAALEHKSRFVLTCDCGTTAHEAIAEARAEGVDVVVTDHHTTTPELPPAVAVLNPQRPDCNYPDKMLCGSGVAFKLLHAVYESRGRSVEDLYKYLDLVGIPTVADLVPLTGENRVLTRFGLKVLQRTPNLGLRALLKVVGLDNKPINAGQIAFIIGPRLNAVGRMGEAMRGVRLLLTDDAGEAASLAEIVDSENRIRQQVDRATLEEAVELLDESFDPAADKAIVLASDSWHPGVIGIVASRVVEKLYRPTVLVALDGEGGRGSGRSIPGFHLYDALKACEAYLEQFGGHRYAAGLNIRRDKVEGFRAALNDYASEKLSEDDLKPHLRIDLELPISQATPDLWRFLAHFEPFGQGNPRPVFLARSVELRGKPQVVGEEHLRLKLDAGGGVTSDAIAFGQAADAEWMDETSRIDVAFHLRLKEWQGNEYLQAQVLSSRPTEAAWAASE